MKPLIWLLVLILVVGCTDDQTIIQTPPTGPVATTVVAAGPTQIAGVVGGVTGEPVTVRVLDADGNPVKDVIVFFNVATGNHAVEDSAATTDPNGVAFTFVSLAQTVGVSTVHATVPGLQGSPVVFEASALAADARMITIVSGNGQTAIVGTTLPDSIVVQVEDMFGNGVPGVSVEFTPSAGSGSVFNVGVQSDADGKAGTTWTLGTRAGSQHVMLSASGVFSPDRFTATAEPDPPTVLSMVSGSMQGGEFGQYLAEEFVVEVTDQYGNGIPGVLVSFEITEGNGSLNRSSMETDFRGHASTRLELGDMGQTNRVRAIASGVSGQVDFTALGYEGITLAEPGEALDSVELSWSLNTNPGFLSYDIHRNPFQGVPDLPGTRIVSITDENTVSYSDSSVVPGVRYYYKLYVHFSSGFVLETNEVNDLAGINIKLGGIGFDLAVDEPRDRLYVSVPSLNHVAVISTDTYEITSTIGVGARPHGIDVSLDGTLLFAALNQAGSVAFMDLTTLDVSTVDIGTELGDARTWDVVEGVEDRVFVSSNPGSNGFAYIVQIARNQGNSATRVAGNTIIRARPVLSRAPDLAFLYVGSGFSPNSLYKLDLSSSTAPIILEDDHGSVSGTQQIEVSPDGTLIYLGSGQILSTASFNQVGAIGAGVPVLNQGGSLCYVGGPDRITIYDTGTRLAVDEIALPSGVDQMKLWPSGEGLWVLSDATILGISLKN